MKFAEIFADATGARVFDVSVNGVAMAIDDLDLVAAAGRKNKAYDVDLAVTVGADGLLTVALDPSADNAKISALALYEAPVDPTAASVSVADVTVDEDAAEATITFTRTGASTEAVTISYSTADGTATAGADYSAISSTIEIPAGGDGTVTVTIPLIGDAVDEGDETFTVTIDGATAPTNSVTIADAEATVTLTDNDAPALPVGFGPGDDLDQDGTANADDDDIDGDGVLNGAETFVYDATNAGTALVQGDVVRLGVRHRRHPVRERSDRRAAEPERRGGRDQPRHCGGFGRNAEHLGQQGRSLLERQQQRERAGRRLHRARGPERRDALRNSRL